MKRKSVDDFPEALIERAVLGELSESARKEIEASAHYQERKREIEAQNEKFFQNYPPRHGIESIQSRLAQSPKPSTSARILRILSRPKTIMTVVPIAAVLLFGLFAIQLSHVNELAGGPLDITRAKGGSSPNPAEQALRAQEASLPSLEIWKKNGAEAESLSPGARVKAYDNLQIAYNARGRSHGIIVSLDGRGRLTLHFPESFNADTELVDSGPVVLPYAYQLDDAPYFERFFFVTSDSNFSVDTIWSLMEAQFSGKNSNSSWNAQAQLSLPAGFEATSFLLGK